MSATAILRGDERSPYLTLHFHPGAELPNGKGKIMDWVKAQGGRWDKAGKHWTLHSTVDKAPYDILVKAGFEVSDENNELEPSTLRATLNDYREVMLAKVSSQRATTLIRPRFFPVEECEKILGNGAVINARGQWEVDTTDLIDTRGNWPIEVDFLDPDPARIARELRASNKAFTPLVNEHEAVVPPWFGLELYEYQKEGIKLASGGKTLIGDPPGLGKTRQALGVAAVHESARIIIVTPPIMLTGWERETQESNVINAYNRFGKQIMEGEVILWAAGKKTLSPPPNRGAVIVSDSLLVSRPQLAAQLKQWGADLLIVDECHRQKTWSSKRSKTIRDLRSSVGGPTLALTGTPLFANPVELAGVLAVSGHLNDVFGGYRKFINRYAYQNKFKAWVAKKERLPELKSVLLDKVMVRRERDEVLNLPPHSRHTQYVDVDLKLFKETHKDVMNQIKAWVLDVKRDTGIWPTENMIDEYARNSLPFVSQLRRAAGLSKIPAAQEIISEWLTDEPQLADGTWPHPLVVWAHHKSVVRAAYDAVAEKEGADAVRVIDGGTSLDARAKIVDDFQAGKIAVLVASITAAGVGITLTRSTDAFYVETDWTPAMIQQADLRSNRIGQIKPTRATTLIAPETLDEYIHNSLKKKSEVLEAVLGGSHDVSAEITDYSTPMEILKDMIEIAVDEMSRKKK